MSTNTINSTYSDRSYDLWRLIYLALNSNSPLLDAINAINTNLLNITSPTTRGVSSATLTSPGSTDAATYTSVRFYNPSTNASSVLINGVPLPPGGSRTYSVEKPDKLGSISYDPASQIIYVEYIQ